MASHEFFVELWVEYGIGMSAFALRFLGKWHTTRFSPFGWDDVFCVMSMLLFTLDAALTDTYAKKGSAVGLTTETAALLPPDLAHEMTIGEKSLFTAWICYICLTWCLKAVMLCLYSRMTMGLWQQKLVKAVGLFCFISWGACIVAHFAVCTPLSRALRVVPYPGDACVLRKTNHALVGALNIICDLLIMAIPIPIIFAAKIHRWHKAMLLALFTSAIFVVITVILRVYYSLGQIDTLPTASGWALRETFVSVIVVTAPGIKPLFSKSRWIRGTSGDDSNKGSGLGHYGSRHRSAYAANITGGGDEDYKMDAYELASADRSKPSKFKGRRHHDDDATSEEHIIMGKTDEESNGGIHVTTEYRLEHETSDASSTIGKNKVR